LVLYLINVDNKSTRIDTIILIIVGINEKAIVNDVDIEYDSNYFIDALEVVQ